MKLNVVLHIEDSIRFEQKNGRKLSKLLESTAKGIYDMHLQAGIKYELKEPSGKLLGGVLLRFE